MLENASKMGSKWCPACFKSVRVRTLFGLIFACVLLVLFRFLFRFLSSSSPLSPRLLVVVVVVVSPLALVCFHVSLFFLSCHVVFIFVLSFVVRIGCAQFRKQSYQVF